MKRTMMTMRVAVLALLLAAGRAAGDAPILWARAPVALSGRMTVTSQHERPVTARADTLTMAGDTNGFVWPSVIPADCPFPRSTNLTGLRFTGRHSD